jgi:hypothetical protein
MAKINTLNYQTVAAWNGSQDLFIVEQPDGTKVATPAMVKQYVLGNSIDDIYSVMGQMGAKNLIPYPYYESDHTESGITWTVNSDGSVTANGTATANSTFIFRSRIEQIKCVEKNTSYILSGCPSGGSRTKYVLDFFAQNQDGTNVVAGADYGNGYTINVPNQDYYGIYAVARVISGQTVSNLTFKPMLRLASDTDNTYQPYAKTNKELTEVIGDISQTGLTGDSVAEQLGTAKNQIANLSSLAVLNDNIQQLNLNTIAGRQSIIYTNANSTNKPSGATWGLVITFNFDANSAWQIYLSVTDSKVYSRSKSGGEWHSWLTLSN